MKKRTGKRAVIITIMAVMIFTLAVPTTSFAGVPGSTQFLIDQAKNSQYVGKTLNGVKTGIKTNGYNGWRMDYAYHWCAWYVANCANAAYIGNYNGAPDTLSKNTYVDKMADGFAKYNRTSKKYPSNYSPKAGDIVVENNDGHIGIMVSSTKAAYVNDGSLPWNRTTVKIRAPYNVTYYIPRPNWYRIYYADDLAATAPAQDQSVCPPKTATFGTKTALAANKFTRSGYEYSYWYIYRNDYNKKTNKTTPYFWSKNNATGKKSWVKKGTAGYTKCKYKCGSSITFNFNRNLAGARIILIPAWTKKSYNESTAKSWVLTDTVYGKWSTIKPSSSTTATGTTKKVVTVESVNAYTSYAYYTENKQQCWKAKNDGYYPNLMKIYSSVSLKSSGYSKDADDGSYCLPITVSTSNPGKLGTVYRLSYKGAYASTFTAGSNLGHIFVWPTSGNIQTIYRTKTETYTYQ